jgi:hypothetical protein
MFFFPGNEITRNNGRDILCELRVVVVRSEELVADDWDSSGTQGKGNVHC